MKTRRTTPPVWLRGLVFVYLGVLIAGPVALVVLNAFSDGIGTFWMAITRPDALHALGLTLLIALVVVPVNTVFGVLCALLLARSSSPARRVISAVVNLPFALSPVVIGLALLLAYGSRGWFGPVFDAIGLRVIFDVPGMILATTFVTLPFVVREVEPVLREIGTGPGAGRLDAGRVAGSGVLADHAAEHSTRGGVRSRPHLGASRRRVWRGQCRVRASGGANRDLDAVRGHSVPGV